MGERKGESKGSPFLRRNPRSRTGRGVPYLHPVPGKANYPPEPPIEPIPLCEFRVRRNFACHVR
jgi:hypothetical protein